MTNELLWALMLVINFSAIILSYKLFGKIGLFVWIPISIMMANIQVVLLVDLFGFGTALGNIVYASGFLVTDILSENHSEKDAKMAVNIGFFSIIIMTIIMQLSVLFAPSDVAEGIKNFESVKTIFSFMPRLVAAGLIAYYASQRFDVLLYRILKSNSRLSKHLFIRNNVSTMCSQLLDNIIFSFLAFYGVFPNEVLFEIFWTSYIMKFIVASIDTPFLYLAKYLKNNQLIKKLEFAV